jgi:hypothetical protein
MDTMAGLFPYYLLFIGLYMQIERLTIHDLCLDIRISGCDGYVVG